MIARPWSGVPSVRGLGAALFVPAAYIGIGHVLVDASVESERWTDLFLAVVLIWPGLGLAFTPWAAGVAERRAGGDRRSINIARALGLATYVLLALIYVFGVPFDDQFFLGGFDTGTGGLD